MKPLAIVQGDETPEGLADLLSLGFQAVVAVGPSSGEAARRASQGGLAIAGLLEVPSAQELAEELGAWAVLSPTDDPRAARLYGADAAARFLALGATPEVLLWTTDEGEDPGPEWDEDLAELVEYLHETGFEGGLGLRGADSERTQVLYGVVREILDAASSWWDGSEDGY